MCGRVSRPSVSDAEPRCLRSGSSVACSRRVAMLSPMDDVVTVTELAHQLGHADEGRAIRRFLLDPDDGQALISGPILVDLERVSPRTAERVRQRFS